MPPVHRQRRHRTMEHLARREHQVHQALRVHPHQTADLLAHQARRELRVHQRRHPDHAVIGVLAELIAPGRLLIAIELR